jgi:hypothetical protein
MKISFVQFSNPITECLECLRVINRQALIANVNVAWMVNGFV